MYNYEKCKIYLNDNKVYYVAFFCDCDVSILRGVWVYSIDGPFTKKLQKLI